MLKFPNYICQFENVLKCQLALVDQIGWQKKASYLIFYLTLGPQLKKQRDKSFCKRICLANCFSCKRIPGEDTIKGEKQPLKDFLHFSFYMKRKETCFIKRWCLSWDLGNWSPDCSPKAWKRTLTFQLIIMALIQINNVPPTRIRGWTSGHTELCWSHWVTCKIVLHKHRESTSPINFTWLAMLHKSYQFFCYLLIGSSF